MPRRSAPIRLTVRLPETEEGQKALAAETARVHADMVTDYIRKLAWPPEKKAALLDTVTGAADAADATEMADAGNVADTTETSGKADAANAEP